MNCLHEFFIFVDVSHVMCKFTLRNIIAFFPAVHILFIKKNALSTGACVPGSALFRRAEARPPTVPQTQKGALNGLLVHCSFKKTAQTLGLSKKRTAQALLCVSCFVPSSALFSWSSSNGLFRLFHSSSFSFVTHGKWYPPSILSTEGGSKRRHKSRMKIAGQQPQNRDMTHPNRDVWSLYPRSPILHCCQITEKKIAKNIRRRREHAIMSHNRTSPLRKFKHFKQASPFAGIQPIRRVPAK